MQGAGDKKPNLKDFKWPKEEEDMKWPSSDEEAAPTDVQKEQSAGIEAESQPDEDADDEGGAWGEEEDTEDEEDEQEPLLYGKDYHTLFDPEFYVKTLYPGFDEESPCSAYNKVIMDWFHGKFSSGEAQSYQLSLKRMCNLHLHCLCIAFNTKLI